MKHIPTSDRPREKLDRLGPSGLGDNELLAIVIGSGSRGRGALDLANAVLAGFAGLPGLTRASHDELRRVPGVGPARSAQILAAVELGRRTLLRSAPTRRRVASARDAALVLIPEFGAARVEQFGVMLLDTKHHLVKTTLVSIGTLDSSVAHPREIFRAAASAAAAAVVLFHNHPSGDPTPSQDDVALTRRMTAAGEIMGIPVVDHVILADTRYFSFRDAKML
jgi:DNA repair protein RadC